MPSFVRKFNATFKPCSCITIFSRNYSSSFKFSDLVIEKTNNPSKKPNNENLYFGKNFTDHMLTIKWIASDGWQKPRISQLRELHIHPAAKVLHYAAEVFEGMKCNLGVDGVPRLFRADINMKRMNKSAARAALPIFDEVEFLKCIKQLIKLDSSWIPEGRGKSLYVRPTLIGIDPTLGVDISSSALLYVILSPSGSYFSTKSKPVALLADSKYCRAWPGGAGSLKLGSNYAPTTYVQAEAIKQNCQQVLWLFGQDESVTEVGTMNVFVYWINEEGAKELATPPLSGLILPGVTRDSILQLGRSWTDIKISEREINMSQLTQALTEGRLLEMFGTGTACVVNQIGEILYRGKRMKIPTPVETSISLRAKDQLLDIQYGVIKPHEWCSPIDEL